MGRCRFLFEFTPGGTVIPSYTFKMLKFLLWDGPAAGVRSGSLLWLAPRGSGQPVALRRASLGDAFRNLRAEQALRLWTTRWRALRYGALVCGCRLMRRLTLLRHGIS